MQLRSMRFEASILPTVLVICVLLIVLSWGVYVFWNGTLLFKAETDLKIRGYDDIESAFTLFRNDSLFNHKFENDTWTLLYHDDDNSAILPQIRNWGGYQLVSMKSKRSGVVSERIYGSHLPWLVNATLYYPNAGGALQVGGKTNLSGNLFLPTNGVRTTQLHGEFFSGEICQDINTHTSDSNLPMPIECKKQYLNGLLAHTGRVLYPNGDEDIATERVILESLAQHAILIARTIIVKEGARIKGQLFATDTIIIEKGAVLEYPSGIYVGSFEGNSCIKICENSSINGYVILDSYIATNQSIYIQAPDTNVNGLIYIKGKAQLQGEISGACFIDKAGYQREYDYYPDLLYNLTINTNDTLAYPIWLSAPYQKKEITWL